MAEGVQSESSEQSLLPQSVRLAGLVLALSALLPFSPAGTPFWRIAYESFGVGIVHGLLVTFAFGAPFWLGLMFALAPRRKPDADQGAEWTWRQLARALSSLMHAQLLLVAWSIARAGVGVAGWSLFGFALVSGVYFATSNGKIAAEAESMGGAPPPPRWLARWTASIIVMVAAWLRLQASQGFMMGIALECGGLAAAFIAWRLSGTRANR